MISITNGTTNSKCNNINERNGLFANNKNDFLPIFSTNNGALDDSVFVIKKQGQGTEDETGKSQSTHSIQSRGMYLPKHIMGLLFG